MTYLVAAYAAVWIGLFLYLYRLARRGDALADEVAMLRERSQAAQRPAPSAPPPAGRPRAEPS